MEMERSFVVVLCFLFELRLTIACESCNPSDCVPPTDCLAGRIKDSCNCCYECGRREGEKCYHLNVPTNDDENIGQCGEGLECRLRTDLPTGDPPEAWCVCKQTSKLCGSDGITYENQCQLTEERYRRRDGLRAISRGPCRFPPDIVTPPENIRNRTGGYVAFFCEAIGWPLPTIEWKRRQSDGEIYVLPGDNTHIAVQSRNGNYEVSSWLQFVPVQLQDAGIYWCRAENDEGVAETFAQLIVSSSWRGQ